MVDRPSLLSGGFIDADKVAAAALDVCERNNLGLTPRQFGALESAIRVTVEIAAREEDRARRANPEAYQDTFVSDFTARSLATDGRMEPAR